jgi:hypothetical protein
MCVPSSQEYSIGGPILWGSGRIHGLISNVCFLRIRNESLNCCDSNLSLLTFLILFFELLKACFESGTSTYHFLHLQGEEGLKPVKTYQERPTPKDLEDVSDVKESSI